MKTVCASGSGGSSSAASETTSSSWSDERSTDAGDVVAVEKSVELRVPGKPPMTATKGRSGKSHGHNQPQSEVMSAGRAWP